MISLAVKNGSLYGRIAKIEFINWANYSEEIMFSKAKIRHEIQVLLLHLKIVLLSFEAVNVLIFLIYGFFNIKYITHLYFKINFYMNKL